VRVFSFGNQPNLRRENFHLTLDIQETFLGFASHIVKVKGLLEIWFYLGFKSFKVHWTEILLLTILWGRVLWGPRIGEVFLLVRVEKIVEKSKEVVDSFISDSGWNGARRCNEIHIRARGINKTNTSLVPLH